MSTEKTKSKFEQLLEDGFEAVQRPFVKKRMKRAFESAKDSLEEQLIENEAAISKAQNSLAQAAKTSENLKVHIQALIDLRVERENIETSQRALETEVKEFM